MPLFVRRLVSGHKSRYRSADKTIELDLAQLSDRITLLAWPGRGMQTLYRNDAKEVSRYLEGVEGEWWIFNLVPAIEDSYPSSLFQSRVTRFPFPDHFPPPFSLIPLLVARADTYLSTSSHAHLLIHCKAGKGRSGTMAIAILLARKGMPGAPAMSRKEGERPIDPSPREAEAAPEKASESEEKEDYAAKLEELFKLHTERRMAPGTKARGVSIASQRRWLGYWAKVLQGQDPREVLSLGEGEKKGERRVRLVRVEVTRGEGGLARKDISIQVRKYRDSYALPLRARELAALSSYSSSYSTKEQWEALAQRDEKLMYGDEVEMLEEVGWLCRSKKSKDGHERTPGKGEDSTASSSLTAADPPVRGGGQAPVSNSHTTVLYPARPIVLSPSRELQLKIVLGSSPSTPHGKLPSMAALGVVWLIPAFEGDGEARVTEVDFGKKAAGLREVRVFWEEV